jgi:WD40 repeat protein
MRLSVYFVFLLACLGILGNVNAQYNFNVKRTLGETNHQIVYASYNSDGKYIITAGTDSSIIIWNADSRIIYRTLAGLKGRPNVAVFSADNEFVLSGGWDNKVSMWALGTDPKIVKTFEEGYTSPIKSLGVSPDRKYFATGSAGGTIKIWDIRSTNLVYDLKGHNKNKDVNAVAFSPDGKTLASGGDDGMLILWNIENGILIGSRLAQKNGIQAIAFSPDGKLLASCGYDNIINIWQVPGLNNQAILKGHNNWVQTIDFSPDSKTLISGGRDEFIILWDVTSGTILHKSGKQGHVVLSLDFSPVRPDFISASYKSEVLETWALSGLNTAQWEGALQKQITGAKTETDEKRITSELQMPGQKTVLTKTAPPSDKRSKVPMIELFSPVPVQNYITCDKNEILMIGRVNDSTGINAFLINNKIVKLSDAGVFQFNCNLVNGENFVYLTAVNKIGKRDTWTIVINCTSTEAIVEKSIIPDIEKGKYYALLIGINDYLDDDLNDLDYPISDVDNLNRVLLSGYTFEKENIIVLKNPKRAEIMVALDDLGKKLTLNDNLLIFYAGHGYWDEKGKVGYWFPADAAKKSTVDWFRNSTLRDFIGSIQTRHTLLIADACFSGAIFKSRGAFSEPAPLGVQKLYEVPSRKAMTSGILEEVPDKSVFMEYFIKRLAENKEKYLSSEVFFSSFKTAVMNNSSNVPQFGVIQNVGDEGGDFIFIKKD